MAFLKAMARRVVINHLIDFVIQMINNAGMSKTSEGLKCEKKDLILSVATRLFARDGLKGISIREICEASECNVASISYHFRGKDKLYAQCLKQVDTVKDKLICCLQYPENADDFLRRLEAFCLTLCEFASEYPESIRLTIQELNANFENGSLSDTFLVSLSEQLSEFFRSAIERNLLPSDMKPELTARVLLGGLIFHKIFFKSHENPNDKDIVSNIIRNCTWSKYA